MKKIYRILFLLLISLDSISIKGQDSLNKDKIILTLHGIKLGSNYSWYKTNIGKYNLGNFEFFTGYVLNSNIKSLLRLDLSFHLGVKKGHPYTNKTYSLNNSLVLEQVIREFDKTLSYNYYFVELPFNFGINISKAIDLNIGYLFRYYLHKTESEEFDLLNKDLSFIYNNRFENGISLGGSVHLRKRLNLNCKYIVATKNIYSNYLVINEIDYFSKFKYRAVQLNLQYLFK